MAFQQTPKGRAGLVGVFATSGGGPQVAADRFGNMGGRPGVNPLRMTAWYVVTPEQLNQLKAIRADVMSRRGEVQYPVALPRDEANRVRLFDSHHVSGPKAGDYLYELNQGDFREILLNVRNGKEYADYLAFMIHSHQNPYAFQGFSFSHVPASFEVELAHAVIDSGADIYAASGMHTLKGVEIYKGRPVFCGLSNFVFHENLLEMSPGTYTGQGDNPLNPKMTAVEIGAARDRAWLRQGVPMTPSPAKAREILERLQRLSEPIGTRIAIENGIGVIRP